MHLSFPLVIMMAGLVLCGCKSGGNNPAPNNPPIGIHADIVVQTRNNALSLLYQILSDEQNVSKLLIIKLERKELHDVIKKVSVRSGQMVTTLEQLSQADRTLNLKSTELPPGEKAARDAQSKTVTKELLHTGGTDFEFKLLLTQAEAMEYGSNLAKVAAANESDAGRRKQIADISTQLQSLFEDVTRLLRHPESAAARK
ncbi:MAG: hypothetical protein JWM68_3692 [Verrucomicrobiales bacterium]|nr:hypothetical protein [Verrucomicrobiales bacterium]